MYLGSVKCLLVYQVSLCNPSHNLFLTVYFVTSFTLCNLLLTLNLPTTTIVAQPFNVIKWQLKFNPVA